jgi:NitT/TauT family transport system ATP-binding protein
MTAKLTVARLDKRFDALEALRAIDISVAPGEFISVVGPSGCGKTTFLRIVAGLEAATAGQVLIDGQPVTGPGSNRGFVFQNDNLLPWRTVLGNAMIGPEVAGRAGAAERRRTLDLLRLVGLEGFEHYHPRQLSGGMRQRVNLARALAIDPDILLMDEPFSALDAQTREIMQTELLRIWEQGRKTVLFVTHQIDEAVFLSDRVLVFARRPGRLQESVDVTLPRPRALAMKRTPEFVRYVDHIWRLIEDDVRACVFAEGACFGRSLRAQRRNLDHQGPQRGLLRCARDDAKISGIHAIESLFAISLFSVRTVEASATPSTRAGRKWRWNAVTTISVVAS